MKLNLFKSIILSACIFTLAGCDDFLDPTPTDRYSDKVVWESEANADLYLNGFYTYIEKYGVFSNGTFGGINPDGLTDMLKYGSNVAGKGNANLYAYEPTKITPDQNSLGVWGDAYNKIRRVNEFIDGLHQYSKFSEEKNNWYEAQARFFRALVYQELIIRHKTVILLEKPATSKNNPLSSESDCWDFVEKDLDYAIAHLPISYKDDQNGRLTKGAALAFKSRAMLYAKRYQKVVDAANAVINLEENGAKVYALNASYKDAFKSYFTGNKESILEFRYANPNPSHKYDYNFAPGGDNAGFGAEACPTQEMVEEYELATGGKPDWSAWHSSTTTTPPYSKLEPRFQASILYNDATWKGRKVESFIGGKDGYMDFGSDVQAKGKSTTGYFLKKYLDEGLTDLTTKNSTQTWVEIRLAEVYLNLAEALAELNETALANNALNAIRSRVSLPNIFFSGDELKEAVKHERKIELAFEGHYYWDLRRWGQAFTKLNNVKYHALRITKSGSAVTYEYVFCDNKPRLYLEKLQNTFPIPTSEIANNLAVQQLEEWR